MVDHTIKIEGKLLQDNYKVMQYNNQGQGYFL